MRKLKIIVGGIPLGCDNIGDEAILACVVAILRRNFPGCELTVCTQDRTGTEQLLGVHTLPLYGFRAAVKDFAAAVKDFDLYVWGGATGLSDYPSNAVALLRAARQAGVPSVVWGVGMDTELNPAFFRAGGKRKRLLELATRIMRGKVDFVQKYETYISARMRRELTEELRHCLFVAVRDPETNAELLRGGFTGAITGADSAILQPTVPQDLVKREPGVKNIALCFSAQRAVSDTASLQSFLNRLLETPENRLVFLPMNPKTDLALMEPLQAKLSDPKRAILVRGCTDPGQVQSIAAACDVVVSSRLHLLILASNAGTPIAGISRGSKVDNFLANFGRRPAGTVFDCDFNRLYREVMELSAEPERKLFQAQAEDVHRALQKRLTEAESGLRAAAARRFPEK